MADVTFGVKVSEEMKEELTEIMKGTQLTGKEFMNLLLSTYKLEKNKEEQYLFSTDIEELQKLLQRIQNLYLNINQRAVVYIEEEVAINNQKLKDIISLEDQYKTEINKLKEELIEKDKIMEVYKKDTTVELKVVREELTTITNTLDDTQQNLKQTRALNHQYELNIESLKKGASEIESLKVEIVEMQQQNHKLKEKNDELSSEVWFAQREKEKYEEEIKKQLKYQEMELNKLKEKHELELRNRLLEEKILFNKKIELLKEDYYKKYEEQQNQLHQILINKSDLDSKKNVEKPSNT